jgi:hypothetical protein
MSSPCQRTPIDVVDLPPPHVVPANVIEVEAESIGLLRNGMTDEIQPSWPAMTEETNGWIM